MQQARPYPRARPAAEDLRLRDVVQMQTDQTLLIMSAVALLLTSETNFHGPVDSVMTSTYAHR